jgi:hypothetical protein
LSACGWPQVGKAANLEIGCVGNADILGEATLTFLVFLGRKHFLFGPPAVHRQCQHSDHCQMVTLSEKHGKVPKNNTPG